jgi:hypothetical protein
MVQGLRLVGSGKRRLTRVGLPMAAEPEQRGCRWGTGQAGVGVGGGVRGHCEATAELGVASPRLDGDRSSRSTMGCARRRKVGDAELMWACRSSTCLTVGALARRQHRLTGRVPRSS